MSYKSLQQNMLYLLRWLYSYTEQLEKSSWLPLSTPTECVKLILGDTWWVIALSTRPLVLLTGLVWSFIYTPFCSGFQDNFLGSLQSTNYKERPASLGGMLNREKDRWFGCLLQKQKNPKLLNRFSHFGLHVGLVKKGWSVCDSLREKDGRMYGWETVSTQADRQRDRRTLQTDRQTII